MLAQPADDWPPLAATPLLPTLASQEAQQRIAQERLLLLKRRDYLQNRLSQALPLLRLIHQEVRRRQLPALLALLPLVESGYRPDARSPVGALGLWQLMPATAMRYGVPVATAYDGRLAVPQATDAALSYLTDLHQLFDGDWLLALAAYNCGENRVKRVQQQSQQSQYWQLPLPEETRRYVPRLLALAQLLSQPARYGLQLPPWNLGDSLSVVHYPGPLWLQDLAAQSRWSSARLLAYNPALAGGWLPAGQGYALLLPRQGAARPRRVVTRRVEPRHPLAALPPLVNLSLARDPLILLHLVDEAPNGLDLAPRPLVPVAGSPLVTAPSGALIQSTVQPLTTQARAPADLSPRPLLSTPAGTAGHSG